MIDCSAHAGEKRHLTFTCFTVLELCGGDMENLSSLELLKRDDLQFQVVDETNYDSDDDDIELPDELGELFDFDDEDDDQYY